MPRIKVTIALVTFLLVFASQKTSFAWQFLGPSGGTIQRILFDPKSNIQYAQGEFLFRSNNSGLTWKRLKIQGDTKIHPISGKLLAYDGQSLFFSTDHGNTWNGFKPTLPFTTFTKDFEFHSQDDRHIYAGTNKGIFISKNGGSTWLKTSKFPEESCPELEVSTSNGNIAYISGSGRNIKKTTNGGESWFAPGRLPDERIFCNEMAVDPIDPNVVYIAAENKIIKTIEGGKTWGSFVTSVSSPEKITINPRNVQELFIQNEFGIWRSIDAGKKWKRMLSRTSDLPVAFIESFTTIAAHPKLNLLLLGIFPQGIFRSTDGGINWNASNRGFANLNIINVEANINASSKFYAAGAESRRLFYTTTDRGHTWRLNKSTPEVNAFNLISNPSNPLILASHLGDTIQITGDGGSSWQIYKTPAIGQSTLSFHSSNPAIIFLGGGTYQGSAGFIGVGIARSDDSGKTWKMKNNGLSDTRVFAFAVESKNGNHVIASALGGQIFETNDLGEHWSVIASGLPIDSASSLTFDVVDSNLLYINFLYQGIYRSTDGGRTWSKSNLTSSYYTKVLADPVVSKTVYALLFEQVYISKDGGESWTPLDSKLPDFVTDLAFTNDSILAATRIGVFSRPKL